MLVLGIDDAGRGPVIGPMVIAGVLIESKDIPRLKAIGVKDSKLLTPEKRRLLFKEIGKMAKAYSVIKISPGEIDNAVDSETTNLNWLEADKMIEVIKQLDTADIVYIDCPSNNISAYTNYLEKKLKKKTNLRVEHKADLKYEVVGAASIIAKVTRDEEIEKIKKEIGKNLGSGYPSDEITQKFLKENYKRYPNIMRKSWASYKNLVKGERQKKIGDF